MNEEKKPSGEIVVEGRFAKWFDNFWYHYKWHVIIGLFVIVFLVVAIGQMIDKDKVDAYVMYAGPTSFMPSEIDEMQNAFREIMPDLNGDGKKIVEFINIVHMTDEDIENNKKQAEKDGVEYKPDLEFIAQQKQKLKLQLAAGDAYILLLDPDAYSEDYEVGMYEKLETIGIESEFANDDSSIKFKETDYGKFYSIFEKLPDDTLLCLKTLNVMGEAKGKAEQKKYDNQLELMKTILDFELQK